MGAVGLFILTWTMLVGTPHDDLLIASIGVAMMGFGFAEAETRTFQKKIGPGFTITSPARRITLAGILLYLVGMAGALAAVLRATGLI